MNVTLLNVNGPNVILLNYLRVILNVILEFFIPQNVNHLNVILIIAILLNVNQANVILLNYVEQS
jgi:hypothetical protein